jgi:hypothetical protein
LTFQLTVNFAGSPISCEGATTLDTAKSAYGANVISTAAVPFRLFDSPAGSGTSFFASVTTSMKCEPRTPCGIVTLFVAL